MKTTRRSWHLLVLMWAVLLNPWSGLSHGLSHLRGVAAVAAVAPGEEPGQRHTPATVCDTCLAFAQLDLALPSHFNGTPSAQPLPVRTGATAVSAVPRHRSVFDARGPPQAT